MVNKGNHPQMALIQVSEILLFTQIYIYIIIYIIVGIDPHSLVHMGSQLELPMDFFPTLNDS